MINYEVDGALLLPFVPKGVELDSWDGKTFVSMVGFLFSGTRVFGVPIPFHREFEEVNLRFYVRQHAIEGDRRGVVFIKEIVPKPAVALIARFVYGEKYVSMPMRHLYTTDGLFEYSWKHQGRWNHLSAKTRNNPQPLSPGSQEEFIAEHYWGYSSRTDGSCTAYRVDHPPWCVSQVSEASLDCDVKDLYGTQFAGLLNARASSAFVADGSPVTVYRGVPVED